MPDEIEFEPEFDDESDLDDSEDDKKEAQNIQLNVSEEIANGVYSNFVVSNYNSEEFVLDFAFLQPHTSNGKVRSRVILNPRNAKRLAHLLLGQIEEYEERFGPVSDEGPERGFQISLN